MKYKGKQVLQSQVKMSEIDKDLYKNFDFTFEGQTKFNVPNFPNIDEDFAIGVIYGSSGSGKSTILKGLGSVPKPDWDNSKTVASHFASVDEAIEKLSAVGLNTVPTWAKPRNVLSNGEGFRADLARVLKSGALIDEFTSVVNREVAKSCSLAITKYIKRNNLKGIVIATCHEDILQWLEPDWVYNTDTEELIRGRLRRPKINFSIGITDRHIWPVFAKHHYLTADLPMAVRCFSCNYAGKVIGFGSSIALPGRIPPLYDGDRRNKFRECRTVILPDFQGMGIGVRFSDAIADLHIERGYRYFSKTAHIRMGEYRESSSLWRATSTNQADRSKSCKRNKKDTWKHFKLDTERICYSHEYIGPNNKSYDKKWNVK
jgi:ABC-type lipoprotein export system ATPase subunit|tara:strand:- start:1087 stop:2208 length:1122 start_codon:yes stop_codon:yes gene_type:complete